MPVGELGDRMSAHELMAIWPAYFRWEEREAERRANAQEDEIAKRRRRSGR